MATSYVSFDEGSTRKVRTFQRTDDVDTVEEWMYAKSESIFDTYIICVTGVSGATGNSHLLQIMAGATNRIAIRRIQVYQAASAVTTTSVPLDLHRLTTAGTGGSSTTLRPTDPASAAASATAMTLPSSKGTEGSLMGRHRVLIHSTLTTVGVNPLLDLSFGDNDTKPLYVAAGTSNGICIKTLAGDSSVTYDIVVTLIDGVLWA